MVFRSQYLLYTRLIAFSYPLLTSCSIQCLINSFASLFVYLIRRVSLPWGFSILLSTTSLNKVINYIHTKRWLLVQQLTQNIWNFNLASLTTKYSISCSCHITVLVVYWSPSTFIRQPLLGLTRMSMIDVFDKADHHK